MMEEEKMSLEEMKKVLKEANLLEDNMSFEEVLQTCQIIRQSEISVNEEIKNSTLNVSQNALIDAMEDDSDTTPNLEIEEVDDRKERFEDKSPEKVKATSPDIFSEEVQNKLFQDANEFEFGFNDMPKSTGSMLDIIIRTSKFVPFQNEDKFLEAGLTEKAKIIYRYHSFISKLKTSIARRSFNPAPMPKQINLLLDTRDYNSAVNSEEVDDETYISRFGRHTKRKLYCDYEEDSGDNGAHKKTKTGLLKKSIVAKSIKKQEDGSSTEVEPAEEKEMNPVDVPKPTSTKKLSNLEIMSRSSLFGDSPRQLPRTRTTRTEMMFYKLVEEGMAKQKSEKQMEQFEKSLPTMQEEGEPEKDVITVEDEEPFKVRVVPPIPGRRPINGRKNKTNEPPALDITVKSSIKSSTSENNDTNIEDFPPFVSLRRNRPWLSKNKSSAESTSSMANSSKKSTPNEVVCPICSKSFSQSKIEDHASACGD